MTMFMWGNRAPEEDDVSHREMHRMRIIKQSLLKLETMRGDAVAEELCDLQIAVCALKCACATVCQQFLGPLSGRP